MALSYLLNLTKSYFLQQQNGIGNAHRAIILNEMTHLNQVFQMLSAIDLSPTVHFSTEANKK